ncbi:hypothetical protein QR685DRAFT_445211 [Neurospora intermedia]|uniref:SWIRM domain-containing protein n=1 Tax=Neurospora intermedia TaxID=5142 RepID=A0ABR3DAN5_NEUIN
MSGKNDKVLQPALFPMDYTMMPMSSTSTSSKPKRPFDISNLMSPPGPAPYETFNLRDAAMPPSKPMSAASRQLGPNPPISPPISPYTRARNSITTDPRLSISDNDPILYPAPESAASPPSEPLFVPSVPSAEPLDDLVNNHIASRPQSIVRATSPPKPEEYELVLFFKSECLKMWQKDPRDWLRKERQYLRADKKNHGKARPMVNKLPTILPAAQPPAPAPRPQVARTSSIGRVQKPRVTKAPAQNPRPIRATPTHSRQTARVSATPEPRVRTVAPNREDKDFDALPDYTPSILTLPNTPGCLKVDWKGNALDLSKDPNRALLHDEELSLAAALRLDCATYLTSKRRIFMRRIECAKIGKEFRKTDAQQACKIDVNKASKLWTAYERVGWLDPKHIERFLYN